MNRRRPDQAASPRAKVAAWVVIALAVAAFWVCVWFGIVAPLLDAWRGR